VAESVCRPFHAETLKMALSASIGMARYPDQARDSETLLNAAEVALREAKKSRSGQVLPFNDTLSKTHALVLEMDVEIRRNIDQDLIEMHYQPQICFKSGALRGLEALARFRDANGDFVNTQSVFDVAEQRGLSQDLSREIFEKFELDLERILVETSADTTVSINISPADLKSGSSLLSTLERWRSKGFDTSRICIELTEECLFGRGSGGSSKILEEISQLGFALSLDDFGTGHASLSNLRDTPIDELKIDKQFVDDLGDKKNEAILAGIIDLANKMNITCVVEGIESRDQFLRLRFLNAEIGQGYFWSKPMPLDGLLQQFASKLETAPEPEHPEMQSGLKRASTG